MMFKNVKELVQLTEERNTSISEIMIVQEMEVTGKSREEFFLPDVPQPRSDGAGR
ncbi:hypothetical protein BsIDN1_28840 [Bacillus safensis]|uniref:Uncharacterized protein n=1 Tax=Bacillus safensis TaxID=561879 RepID=A0A5S9MCJ2_BACIA|nr:hypothetical protein BsIDN1_28840 [Bacillus safensis]